MLDVNNVLPTLYKDRKMKNCLRFTHQMIFDRKRTEEGKKCFQNKCVSSQNHRSKKEEGATVDLCRPFCHLPSPLWYSAAGLVRAERAAILHGDLTLQESPIKYR